jgi:hemolysin activation/secretion protein
MQPMEPPNPAPNGTPVAPPKNDSEILLENLRGVVFVPSPHDVLTGGASAKGIVFRGVVVPDPKDFDACVQPYLGQKLTRGDLNKMVSDIILYYRNHDRPVVDVIVPQQEITNGVVQLVLLEARVGTVTVTGNRWFSSEELRSDLRVRTGDTISGMRLQSDLDWVNQNPFHSSDLVYQPGKALGETDIVLKTQDRFPVRFYGGYEDNGNAATGFDRYSVGFNWGDAFELGLGQQLNYQYTTSGSSSLQAQAASYIIPLPWRHTLTFFGSYATTQGTIPPLINLTGTSYQVSGRYGIPLPTLTKSDWGLNLKESFSFGFDYKYNNNSLLFTNVPAGATLVDVDQFVVGYDGALHDPYGETTLNETLYLSPGNMMGGNNTNAAFNASHTGATANYIYDTMSAQRITKLPYDFSLLLRGVLQLSDSNLTPSEQMGFGGYDSVRGYDDREVNTDEGFTFTTELRTPPVSLGEFFGCHQIHDQLQFLGFWDYGAANNYNLLPGEPSQIPLSAVGGGLRYSVNTYLSVRFDYGFQLLNTGLDNDHGGRGDVGVVVSY